MKNIKKILAVTLASVSVFSAFAACAPSGGEIAIDETKTQLYVNNYNAGIGKKWIESIGAEFEKDFAGYSFEEGKTGVQIIYEHNRVYTGTVLESNISGSENNIFFTEGVDYPSLMTKNLVYDVTDIINEPAVTGVDGSGNVIRETETIKSKIDEAYQSYLNVGTGEQEVYGAVPYSLTVKGMVFDKDLWNEKSFYLAKGATPAEFVAQALNNGGDVEAAKAAYQAEIDKLNTDPNSSSFWTLVNENGEAENLNNLKLGLSAGPDAKYGTYDDGMPATVDEFYLLMDSIAAKGITPYIFTGKFPGYGDMMGTNVWINYEGKENMDTFFSLTGTSDELVVLDANGKIQYNDDGSIKTESMTFDGGRENGYEVQRQLGKYYALQFSEKLATSSNWLASECDNTAISHIAAQTKFLASCVGNNKRIAMLGEGAWWMQESDDTFTMMASDNEKYSKMNRNLGYLSAPNATVGRMQERFENNEKNLMLCQNHAFMFINNNLDESSPQLAVAKMFLSYVNNDEMMNLFTEITSMYRAMKYEISEDTYGRLTKYAQNFITQVAESEIIYPYSNNELVKKNYGYLEPSTLAWNWRTKTFGSAIEAQYPLTSLRKPALRAEGLNAETYFAGLYNYNKNTVWGRLI